MESVTPKSLSEIKFNDLNDYLTNNSCFGFTATRRKRVIIYSFRRYYIGLGLSLKVMVDRKTKNVISVMNNGKAYTTFEDVKNLVERNDKR